jgi:hypothetical protein
MSIPNWSQNIKSFAVNLSNLTLITAGTTSGTIISLASDLSFSLSDKFKLLSLKSDSILKRISV